MFYRHKQLFDDKLGDYWLLNRSVVMSEKQSKFFYPVKGGTSTIQYYITDSELFHVLREAHLASEHGGRNRILKELSTKYKNALHVMILNGPSTFLSLARKNEALKRALL
ncbi:KRAB-A domain-containing protein 2 [Trichonephila clavipes]|nr:KRAB-A domain-containing protein 2 [Trichonephila clavipes]